MNRDETKLAKLKPFLIDDSCLVFRNVAAVVMMTCARTSLEYLLEKLM